MSTWKVVPFVARAQKGKPKSTQSLVHPGCDKIYITKTLTEHYESDKKQPTSLILKLVDTK